MTATANATTLSSAKDAAIRRVDDLRDLLQQINRAIWSYAEPSLQEHRSSALLAGTLERHGFHVERGVAGMPTSFVASYGQGRPVIAILAEYDALPSLSQKAQPAREPVTPGAHGHGCGHSVFGTACTIGALAARYAMEQAGIGGTLRVYGTPAEELLVGKVYMVRAGLFADVDAAITWHPGDKTGVTIGSSKAMVSVRYTFHGRASHASASPHRGRSALDAVELMNIAANYMREHIKEDARIHYVITSGGMQPNVVPPEASVWYFVRANSHADVEAYLAWLDQIAQGAALMTQTTLAERRIDTDCHEVLPNRTLAEVLDRNLRLVGPPQFTDEEKEFARQIQATFDTPAEEPPLREDIEPLRADGGSGSRGSTDVGDVSWQVPTGQFRATTHAHGCPGHSWQIVACTGTSIGEKGGAVAAKTLACAALELLADAEVLAAAQKEFKERRGDRPYTLLIPPDQPPPLP